MVAILDPKGRRPDPANETGNTIRNPASDNSNNESLLPAQEAVSQARRQVRALSYCNNKRKVKLIWLAGDTGDTAPIR